MFLPWMTKRPVFEAPGEGGSGGGAPDPAGTPAPDQQSILYPDAPAGDPPVDPAKPADPAADPAAAAWKEYEPDAAKSDAENATAKAEHDKAKPAAADPADTVPEDGKYAVTLEGMEVDTVLLEAISPAMKEAGLTGKQAQTLAAAFAAHQATQAEAWGKTVTDWVGSAKADTEIGGANWDTSIKGAQTVMAKFGTPELREFLNASGAGNHPEMIRLMARVGAVIAEDKPTGTTQGGQARDAVTVLYPEDKPKG